MIIYYKKSINRPLRFTNENLRISLFSTYRVSTTNRVSSKQKRKKKGKESEKEEGCCGNQQQQRRKV